MPACCTSLSIGDRPASNRNACSRSPNTFSVSRNPTSRSRSRWISLASSWFSRSSARLRVTLTPRDSAVPPSTRNSSATTLPMPTSALTTVCDTSTARDEPDPWGTSMTVQRRSALFFFIGGCKHKTGRICPSNLELCAPSRFLGASRLSGCGLGEWRGRLGDPLPADRKFREVRQRYRCERPLAPQQRPDLPCLLGDKWAGENRQARDAADQIGEHGVELGVAFRFGELPRRRLLDVAIAARRKVD